MTLVIQSLLTNSKVLLALFAFMLASSCSSTATVENRSSQAGIGQTFSASQAEVVSVTQLVLANQGLKVTGIGSQNGNATITFSKPVSAFSWGEVGRIYVTSLGPEKSQVFVTSARRGTLNGTGKSEKTFAREIFAGISLGL